MSNSSKGIHQNGVNKNQDNKENRIPKQKGIKGMTLTPNIMIELTIGLYPYSTN
jgi:hypothetical protein